MANNFLKRIGFSFSFGSFRQQQPKESDGNSGRVHRLLDFTLVVARFDRCSPESSIKAPNGAKVYSLRLSQPMRAVAFRDGDFLRLIPDHDSPYEPCRSLACTGL